MNMLQIKEWAGKITIKYGEYKISIKTLEDLIEQALQDGTIYPELVGKDKLESLIIEK